MDKDIKELIDKEVKEIHIKFEGIDSWSRPIYKDINTTIRYGSTNKLFPDKDIAPNNTSKEIDDYFRKNIGELEYFGGAFNCEPHGGIPKHYKLIIED